MKARLTRLISFILALVIMASTLLTSCSNSEDKGTEDGGGDGGTVNNGGNDGDFDPNDEYFLPKEEGYNQITFYWNGNNIESCDIWAWYDGKEGKGYVMTPCAYGGKVMINIPEGVAEVGFIVRTSCSDPGGTSWGTANKDGTQDDRIAVLEGEDTVIYLKAGDASQYTSTDGGKTLTMIKKFGLAGMISFNRVRYNVTPKTTIKSIDQIKIYDGDTEIPISSVTGLGTALTSATVTVEGELDISKEYRMVIEGYGEKVIVPTEIFDSPEFIQEYTYDGDDLGAIISGENTVFKLWAPTASKVILNLFTSGHEGEAYQRVEMIRGDKGVWYQTVECGHGTYYTYTVTTSVGTQEAVDPYARAAGLNGDRGMVVDLDRTDPEGWGTPFSTNIDSYTDAVVWEIHVRDFSNKIADSEYKGKYLAFTETGLKNEHGMPVGIDYLKELGITHVHLLPVYDYATVNEAAPDEKFNWGYDPKNYNVPEGSYSTDPYNGEVRILEYKKMVMALHEAGIGVVMDVVYNHTYDKNSSFNKIVPYYYYRYTSTGANSSASGCGNDTASERYMFGKFMVDSVKYWLEEYDLDGFRFDLMGLHDLDTMQEIESTVHTIDPEALIYGEGWTMGSTIDGSIQANQTNISRITPTGDAIGGIAVFNDVMRDGLKGSVFESDSKGYISGNGQNTLASVMFGMNGGSNRGFGWLVSDDMVVNYMSAHDNNTLWDKLELSNGDDTVEARLAMNRLGATLLLTSRGMVFMQAGEEMLRTKGGDENSYASPDSVNNIDWSVLDGASMQYDMMLYYKALIEIRQKYSVFTTKNTAIGSSKLGGGSAAITIDDHYGNIAQVITNVTDEAITYTVPTGEWHIVIDGTAQASGELITGEISIPAYSAVVIINGTCYNAANG